MDEVPLTFDCPPNRTVDTCGVKTVSITTGQEKTHFTVMLACCADGTKSTNYGFHEGPHKIQCKGSKRKKKKKHRGVELSIIPGGLRKILQPLDISVNRSFKSHVRACWENWMSESLHTCTKGGNMRRASYTEVAECVDKSWKSVKVSTIRSGFIKAGIVSESEEITDSEDSDAASELSDTSRKYITTV
ncbi:pogo transposable element with KRAB [Trichonephila clavipes]|uniref:Pogo transposable element with KRAB n=1 Tax=Trichonephila clavipes TaxID=2585209 RepID=A0A8X6RV07_TRICX|nr:pogo transposable element with KRAB [Trichonephila clavipes]